MKLAAKLAIVAVGIGIAGTVIDEVVDFAATRSRHEDRVDRQLIAATDTAWIDAVDPHDHDLDPALSELLGSVVFQVVQLDGTVTRFGNRILPIDADVEAMLAGTRTDPVLTTMTMNGEKFRYRAAVRPGRGVAQAAVPIDYIDELAGGTNGALTLAALLALVFGTASAVLVTRRVTEPLTRLAEASQTVTRTGVLDVDIDVGRRDEIGVLAESFRQMLGALSSARDAQRQVVEDVGHELRTPLTSLRTNIELLERHPTMPEELRSDIVVALSAEVREMSALIDRLRDSWTAAADSELPARVRLDVLADDLVSRYRRRTTRPIQLTAVPIEVWARSNCVRGALGNLIDNALKYDTSGGQIEVDVGPQGIWVRDHGAGFSVGETGVVFERFRRGSAAGIESGSGIGLSIVSEAAQSHGGEASAYNHPDGGAVVGFTIAGLPAHELP